jgi:hypothetical protein
MSRYKDVLPPAWWTLKRIELLSLLRRHGMQPIYASEMRKHELIRAVERFLYEEEERTRQKAI